MNKAIAILVLSTFMSLGIHAQTANKNKSNVPVGKNVIDTTGWKIFDSGTIEVDVNGVNKKYRYTFKCPKETINEGRYNFVMGEKNKNGDYNYKWELIIQASWEPYAVEDHLSYTTMEKTGVIDANFPLVWQYNIDKGADDLHVVRALTTIGLSWTPEYYAGSTFFGEKGFEATAESKYSIGMTKEILKSFKIIQIK